MQSLTVKRSQQISQIARAVKAVVDASWVPENLRGNTYFGLYDFWMYEDEKSDSECNYCETYSGELFAGNQLRTVFPDLLVVSPDLIYPNVHWTLWQKDTCKCKLTRVPFGDLPENWTVYSGERTPHYVKEGEEGVYSYKPKARSIEDEQQLFRLGKNSPCALRK